MSFFKNKYNLIEIIEILLIISYMVVTVILHDMVVFKYLRDILLVVLITDTAIRKKKKIEINQFALAGLLLFFGCMVVGTLFSPSLSASFKCIRRYLFPLGLLYVVCNFKTDARDGNFFRFTLIFYAVLSIFGVIQADLIGDVFLRKLGYPLVYSPLYKRDMLYNSFYFGGIGLQRVVATLSSSNIYGLIIGVTMIYLVVLYPYIRSRYKVFFLCCMLLGYVLSFSRSNFLAMVILMIIALWHYVPKKKYIIAILIIGVLGVVTLGIIQGEQGIFGKLISWIQDSLTFSDTSAAGRGGIWLKALSQSVKSPFGIGFGHVGGLTDPAVGDFRFSCENSYLTMALDTGWFGLLGYLVFIISVICVLRKEAKACRRAGDDYGKRINKAGFFILLYLMIVMFFSNHIQDMEAISVAYIYVGTAISYNRIGRTGTSGIPQTEKAGLGMEV